MGEPDCPGCRRLEAEVAKLREQVERLTRLLDEVRRAGKRQAAPFSKGPPKGEPKRPGRKAGEDWVAQATTGAVLTNGNTLLAVADRSRSDPNGKTIHKITQSYSKTH